MQAATLLELCVVLVILLNRFARAVEGSQMRADDHELCEARLLVVWFVCSAMMQNVEQLCLCG
jgi:hypothetical protein